MRKKNIKEKDNFLFEKNNEELNNSSNTKSIVKIEENPEESNNSSNTKSIVKIEENPELMNYNFSECLSEAKALKEDENFLCDDANPIEYENKRKKFMSKNNLKFIKKVNNLYFILVYQDGITIADNELNKNKDLNIENIMINNICVREQKEEIIICSNNSTKLLALNNGELITDENLLEKSSYSCVEISNNNLIICEEKGVFLYSSLFDITNEDKNPNKISDKSYKGVIAINENVVAIISNKNIDNGEDKLLFYNIIPKNVVGEIVGYSFNLDSNGLFVISNKKNKILLCSCKRNEKNGILYIYIEKDNPKFNEKFIDTEDFKVYCFWQLLNKSNNLFNNKNEENTTDYILVGGLNHKKKGTIKVYKVENKEIIITDNPFYSGFVKESKSAINNIIQNKNNQKIIIGNLDGAIYLLDTPDISD